VTTDVDIVNRSLQMIGSQSQITSFTDGSPEAASASIVYESQVETLLRTYTWDFARKEASLSLTGNAAPYPWSEEFAYPNDAIEVRTLYPSPSTIATYDPLPFRWAEGTNSAPVRVLWTNLQVPVTCVYTWNLLGQESLWDTSFVEAAICKIASVFAMSIASRPDLHKSLLEEAQQWIGEGTGRDY
jgi:hypothetical protein